MGETISHDGFTLEQVSSKFIQQIREEVRKGYSVVPFVGSGISAASGILMGQEFSDYLAHTVVRVLKDGWDIRYTGWPEQPTQTTRESNKEYLKEGFKEICKQINLRPKWDDESVLYGFEDFLTGNPVTDPSNARPITPRIFDPSSTLLRNDRQLVTSCQLENKLESLLEPTSHPNLSKTSKAYVEEAAIRRLFDWRATLNFLASVTIDPQSRQAMMGEFDSSVIDSFNRHITVGRKPNLGHKMLAHLSRPLRSRLFLTTNFDNLLEQALAALKFAVETVDVRTGGTLPPPSTVRAQNTILKLHGSLIETRADFTLDSPPAEEEKRRLADIVLGNGKPKHILSHLLVVGYSGYDRRCVLMIKHLLDSNQRVKVFWMCFNDGDVSQLDTLFHEKEYKNRVVAIKTPRPDLLLYEMYQELTFSLPAGGSTYEFTHKVPPRPLFDPDDNHRFHATEPQDTVARQIAGYVAKESYRMRDSDPRRGGVPRGGVFPAPERAYVLSAHRPQHEDGERWFKDENEQDTSVYVLETESGSLTAARLAFDVLEKDYRKKCLWMELQDYVDPRHVMDDLFRSLSLLRGVHQIENLKYVYRFDESRPHVREKGKLNAVWVEEEIRRARSHYANLLEYFQFADNSDTKRLATNLVVFMYGRSVPGACSGHRDSCWSKEPDPEAGKNVSDYELFHLNLEVLSRCGITVLYMPMSQIRYDAEKKKKERLPSLRQELGGRLRDLGILDTTKEPTEYGNKLFKVYQALRKEFSVVRLASDKVENAIDPVCPTELEVTDPDTTGFYTTVNSLLSDFFSTRLQGQYSTLVEDTPDVRYRFLYTVTLFRQSRHVSAFLSEAALRCPHRFKFDESLPWGEDVVANEDPLEWKQRKDAFESSSSIFLPDMGPDNDLTRKALTDLWIRVLRKHEVFLYKAGAYCWKFRDIRHALRDVLEFPSSPDDPGGIFRSKFAPRYAEGELILDFMGQVRPRTHLWIGSWYVSAYMATGHTNPLIEALYHYLQAIAYSFVSNSTSRDLNDTNENQAMQQRAYSAGILVAACFELRKLLRLSIGHLPDYGFGSNPTPKAIVDFQEAISNVDFRPLYDGFDTEDWESQLHEQQELQKYHFQQVEEDIARAITFPTTQFGVRDRQIRFLRDDSSSITLQISNELRAICNTKNVATGTAAECRNKIFSGVNGAIKAAFSKLYSRCVEITKPLNPETFDQVVGKDAALDQLLKFGDRINELFVDKNGMPNDDSNLNDGFNGLQPDMQAWCISSGLAKTLSGWTVSPVALVLAATLVEAAYAFLKRAKIEVLAEERHWSEEYPRRHLIAATLCCNLAERCCRLIPPEQFDAEIEVRIKILALYGTCLGYLKRYFEAHRHLNSAMALLSKSPGGLNGLPLAIIRLRRAEVFLAFAKRIWRRVKSELDEVEQLKHDGVNHPNALEKVPDKTESLKETVRQFYATLDDAVVHLEYAEKTLADVASESLWWGRHIIVMLRCFSVMPRKNDADRLKTLGVEIEPVLLRKRQQVDATIRTLFRRLVNTMRDDNYRRLRAVDLFVRALDARLEDGLKPAEQQETLDIADRILTETADAVGQIKGDNLLKVYVRRVRTSLNKLKLALT